MKSFLAFLLPSIITLVYCSATLGQDYQKIADESQWTWSADRATVMDSLMRFSNDFQVEVVRPKNKFGDITIRVQDGDKELAAWNGNYRSVFTSSGNVLVYADFLPTRTGCALVGYDLKTGKQLWKTNLKGLGPIAHFGYSNAVNLDIINNDAARVFGNESAGQYLEIVDLKTGKMVGHRRYKK